jgi:hypothetical protein
MITRTLSISAILIATTVSAQPAENRQDRGDGPARVFGGPPGFHLAVTLDANADGKISTKEIENATIALKALDKDNDGKLSGEEIGWPPSFGGGFPGFGPPPGGGPPGGRGGFGGGGFPGFGPPPGGGPPGGGRGSRGGFGGGGFGGQGPARRPEPDTESSRPSSQTVPSDRSRRSGTLSASQLKSTDRNKDGKITTEEIPKLLRESILGRVDTNKDGEIDEAELDALAKQQAAQK